MKLPIALQFGDVTMGLQGSVLLYLSPVAVLKNIIRLGKSLLNVPKIPFHLFDHIVFHLVYSGGIRL